MNIRALNSFIDLIRHGKHHHQQQPQQQQQQQHGSPKPDIDTPVAAAPSSHGHPAPPTPPTPQADILLSREAAEQIVRQEREAQSQMPSYQGLERFRLEEKMGEYVSPRRFDDLNLITTPAAPFPMSIALSIRRLSKKLLVRNTCRRLSPVVDPSPVVKVVRKFELNAQQVSRRSTSIFLLAPLATSH